MASTSSPCMPARIPAEAIAASAIEDAVASPPPLAPGRVLVIGNDRYRIQHLIGQGASAYVYRVIAERATVRALKVLRPECASPLRLERWKRESTLLTTLSHPNLLKGYASGVHAASAPLHYILMEYVEGRTLDALSTAELGLSPILRIAFELACVLNYLYLDGRVSAHRDLKPTNIMVGSDGHIKLLDLGIAKTHLRFDMSLETQTVGTLRYMAPEQFGDARAVDIRCDLYALGIILLEMLEGARVSTGSPQSLIERRFSNPSIALDPASQKRWFLDDETFSELDALIRNLTAIEVSVRCQTPEEAMTGLLHLVHRIDPLSIPAHPIPPETRNEREHQGDLTIVMHAENAPTPDATAVSETPVDRTPLREMVAGRIGSDEKFARGTHPHGIPADAESAHDTAMSRTADGGESAQKTTTHEGAVDERNPREEVVDDRDSHEGVAGERGPREGARAADAAPRPAARVPEKLRRALAMTAGAAGLVILNVIWALYSPLLIEFLTELM